MTSDITEIQRIRSDYYDNYTAIVLTIENKLINNYNIQSSKTEIMRKQKLLITTIKDNESVFKTPYKQKYTTRTFPPELHPIFTEGLIPILLKLFQTIEQKVIFPNSFYNTCIIQILKPKTPQ